MESPETGVGMSAGIGIISMLELLFLCLRTKGFRSLLIHPLYQELMNG